jgi:hypothetical protein
LSLDPDSAVKALGVKWHPALDCFIFNVSLCKQGKLITKRFLASEIAKVFDPLGFLTPFTIQAKIILQSIWKAKTGWDEQVSAEIIDKWEDYANQMKVLEEIRIPRCLSSSSACKSQLIGFSDASEKAYSAVVYLRTPKAVSLKSGSTDLDDQADELKRYQVVLITSKTKVSPVQTVTIPRLELCGAVLLAKLIKSVKKALNFCGDVFCFCNSKVVLDWIASCPSRWKPFVANRIKKIHDDVSNEHWFHVAGVENPADCASRGITSQELKGSKLWWTGPDWLSTDEFKSKIKNQVIPSGKIEDVSREGKSHVVICNHAVSDFGLLEKFSSFLKIRRIMAHCLRFLNNCRKGSEKRSGNLSVAELESAELILVRSAQAVSFNQEILSLKPGGSGSVSRDSKLVSLNPFLESGVLRVGGRIGKASHISESAKHPIILPQNHILTKLIIRYFHGANLHAGPSLLLGILMQKYWILRGKDAIRDVIRRCVVCRRNKHVLLEQMMGSLPAARVNPGRPFEKCGVDYAGPFETTVVKGRQRNCFKSYICLFVCFVTRAIHLEAVSELSSDSFLGAFKRFISRRGLCSDIYSDCGTNFVGADKELQQLLESARHQAKVSDFLSEQGVQWHFNPPGAPHQGGLWEAGVKSVKFHLRRVMGLSKLNFEGFITLLCEIEACVNSRPLCPISNDSSDLEVLTPGHFLIGGPLKSNLEPDLCSLKFSRLNKWQQVCCMKQHFWRRWSAEYLTSLQQRFRWQAKRENVKVGDMVLVKDETLPPLKWKMGRVVECYPGEDGLV